MASIQSLQSFTVLLSLACLLVPAYVTFVVIYQIFFHPLAKYPGPLIAKITDLDSVYHAWRADRHVYFERCHRKYGNIFRYGPNRLSFNTHTALQTINSAKANTRKGDFYKILITEAGPSTIAAIPSDIHARKRRVLSQAFSDRAMKSAEEYSLVHVRKFCDKLASSTEPMDMSKWCTYLTGDVLGELSFGNSFDMLTQSKNRRLMDLINETTRFALVCGCTIPFQYTPLPQLLFSSLLATRSEFRAYAKSAASTRTKDKTSTRRDFYHYLMEAKDPSTNEAFSQQEMWSEAGNLIVAGTDTTATCLAATFFYLTHNPDVLEKVKKRYLRACLDESMRMTPPVPGILPRMVLPGGIAIDGHFISEGVEVGVACYALHHNESYFKDSFVFDPDRFLNKGVVEGWAPFGFGPRACVGRNMAYMEMMCTMARVLFLFEMRGVGAVGERAVGDGGGKGEFRTEDFFVCNKVGPMIEFSEAH